MTDTLTPAASTAVDADEVFTDWFGRFEAALTTADLEALSTLLQPDSWWRDLLALTWDLTTRHGIDDITALLADRLHNTPLSGLRIVAEIPPVHQDESGWIQGFFDFTTPIATGRGVVRLVWSEESGSWRAWTISTTMTDLVGYERRIRDQRPMGPRHLPGKAAQDNWLDLRCAKESFSAADPAVIIIGGGQGGLAVAAQLGLMGVDTLIVEKNARVGDSWRNRYHSLVLHDPVWADHLPYMPFPASWPVYTPKDKLAEWFESYAAALELNVWTSTEMVSNAYDPATGTWTVVLHTAGGERTLHPAHVVLATGASGEPNVPAIPGIEEFAGTVYHSSGHQSAQAWAGKKAIVVGACNSGHDIAQDLCEAGAEVTMVQRSSTYIMSQKHGIPAIFGALYHEHGLPTEYADLLSSSFPWPVVLEFAQAQTKQIAALDADLLERLEATGFALNDGVGSGGLMSYALRNGGGYYIDVGCSELIADGKIGIRQGSGIAAFTLNGIRLDDGTELEADLVVLATGYSNMRETARRLFGDAVANACRPVLGVDEQHELNTLWRSSGQPGFWFMGGPLAWVRVYSKFLALQIAGDISGLRQR